MTIFGILWMLLIVICMFSSFENIAALTIISATIQCSNVLVLNGSGIGPQVITSIAFILRVWLSRRNFKITLYRQKIELIIGVTFLNLSVLLSSVVNSVLSKNFARMAQLYVYAFCFFSMFYVGKFVSDNFIYWLIRKLTIALLVIGLLQLCIKLVDCLEKCLIYGHIRRFAD